MDAMQTTSPGAANAYVEVSPEMTMVLGNPAPANIPLPPDPLTFVIAWGATGRQPRLALLEGVPAFTPLDSATSRLLLIVERAAYLRVGGQRLPVGTVQLFHLPSALQSIAVALRDCHGSAEACKVYRLAKSLELLCETIRLDNAGQLLEMGGQGTLSQADTQRVLAARRLIDEHWGEPLTLQAIARACGLNRAKLTSAFRELFHCSIGEALATKRLEEARRMLLTTDLPVSSVGYRNGYLNNAAFSRAFSRRYGLPPSGVRTCSAVA